MNYLRFIPPFGFALAAAVAYQDGNHSSAVIYLLGGLGLGALAWRSRGKEPEERVPQQRFNESGDLE